MEYKNFTNASDDVIPSLSTNHSFASDVMITSTPVNPQIVIIQAPKMRRSFERYAARCSLVYGILQLKLFQIVMGLCSVVLGIANALTCAVLGVIGYAIWCGILFIISGTFGVVAASKKTSCTIVTHMVMSIISALAAATQFSLGVFSATFDDFAFSPPSTGCYYNVGQYQEGDDIGPGGAVSTDVLLAVFAVLEAVVAVIGSAVSCKVTCCSSDFVPVQGTGGVLNGMPVSMYHQQQQFASSQQVPQVIYYVNQVAASGVSNGQFQQHSQLSIGDFITSSAYGVASA